MKVLVPMLTVTGHFEFDVDADKLDEAIEKIKEHRYNDVTRHIEGIRPNFDAAKEATQEEV